MKKNLSKTILLLVVSCAFLLLAGYCYYYTYSKIQEKISNIGNISSDLKSKKEKNDELDSINRNLKSTMQSHDRLQSLFVADGSVVDFIQNLEQMGKESGLAVSTDSVSSNDSPDLLTLKKEFLLISMTVKGTWAGNMKFLKLLENLPYKVAISSFSSESSDGQSSDNSSAKNIAEKLPKHYWKSVITFSVIKNKPQ